MKKLISWLVKMVLIIAMVLYVPYYFHICVCCADFFVGPGYEANIIVDLALEDGRVICRDCAEKQHAVSTFFGKDLEDFRRPWIEDPLTVYDEWLDMYDFKI